MSRRIITSQMQATGATHEIDGYFDRVLKYIPGDVNAAWLTVTGLIANANRERPDANSLLLWILFGIFVIITFAWTFQRTSRPNMSPAITQCALATAAFIVWVFALGGPFATTSWWQPLYGSIVLIVYTLAVGIVIPRED